MKNFIPAILLMGCLIASCSQKVTNAQIDKLEGREILLEKTAELNKLNLELERNLAKLPILEEKVKDANEKSTKSAEDAKDASRELERNPGDAKKASKADNESKKAASDAKRARKLNDDLNDLNDEIKELQSDVEKVQKDIDELKSKVEFVPNN